MSDIEVTLRGPIDTDLDATDSLIADLEELGSVQVVHRLQESLEGPTQIAEAVNIVLESVAFLGGAAVAARRWVKKRRHEREEGERSVAIYGPDGELLAEVTQHDPEEDQ